MVEDWDPETRAGPDRGGMEGDREREGKRGRYLYVNHCCGNLFLLEISVFFYENQIVSSSS